MRQVCKQPKVLTLGRLRSWWLGVCGADAQRRKAAQAKFFDRGVKEGHWTLASLTVR